MGQQAPHVVGHSAAIKLYIDLGSPYAYLAVERAARVLGAQPVLEPILLGAIFKLRGSGSWSATPDRDGNVSELERRARDYGLAPIVWPPRWPADGLAAMRAATWAKREGRLQEFARAVFRDQFTEGAEITELEVLEACAERAGLDPAALPGALADDGIKRELREATDLAWRAGVMGVPTLALGGQLFYGDDQLELAAQQLAARSG